MNSRPGGGLASSDGRGAQHGAVRGTSASRGAWRCPAGGRPEGLGCSVQPRPSPQAALRAGTSAASTRRDRPQSGRPCAFRERKPAHLRLKWASNPFGRRRFASCECCNLSEVRLGEGQLVAALPVDRSGSDHEKARGKWMLRWQRRGLWRAQPSRTPSQRLGARRRVTPSVGERSRAYGSAAKTGS